MDPYGERELWHVEIFDEAEQVSRFLNHLQLRPDQLVDVRFHPFSSNLQRIMLTCRLTPAQRALRTEWQAVERIIDPPAAFLTNEKFRASHKAKPSAPRPVRDRKEPDRSLSGRRRWRR